MAHVTGDSGKCDRAGSKMSAEMGADSKKGALAEAGVLLNSYFGVVRAF